MMKRNLLFLLTFIVSTMTVWADVKLVASPSTGGTIEFKNGSTTYVEVTPNVNYHVEKVELSYTYLNNNVIVTPPNQTIEGQEYYVITLPQGVTDATVTAYFVMYIVSFKANGGTGTMADDPTNSPYTIPECGFFRVNYTFMGWATSADGGVVYTPEQEITLTEDLTLYAKWGMIQNNWKYSITRENTYEVELMGYDGEKPTGTLTVPSSITFGGQNYSVTRIGKEAFSWCSDLTSVTIPNSVTSIGESAFNHTGLTSITIPNSVTTIGQDAFSGCTGLTPITIPNSVTSIGDYAFMSCTGLTSVYFADGSQLTSIGEGAFLCAGLTSITIPASVTSIGQDAFSTCSVLTSVNFADGSQLTTIGGGAFYKTSLTSITIPNSVTSIGGSAFEYCTGLTSITIPNSVTSIGSYVFRNCTNLTSVTIGSGVTSIGYSAFRNCSNLTSITCWATTPPTLGERAFTYIDNNNYVALPNLKIYVPSGCVNTYKAATNWSVYVDKIDAIPAEKLTVSTNNISSGTLAGNWSTYYNSAVNMQAPEGVTVYKATLSGTSLSLIPIADRIITAGQAVILKKTDTGNIVFSIATATPAGDYSDNVLKGVDATTTISTSAYADKVIYTLAGPNGNLGFYKYTGTTLGANKAFLALDATVTNNAREFLFSLDAEATEIVNTDYSNDTDDGDGQIYDLQGRKVQQPVRGIYVKDGKKIVVK